MLLAATAEERDEAARTVASLLVGFRVDAVQYLIPAAMRDENNLQGLGFEHAEAGLTLVDTDGGSRAFRWSQRGFDEGLWVGESDGKQPGAWVHDVNTIPVTSWTPFEGSMITSAAVVWQRIAPARYSIFSVRLDFAGRSVAIALGERDPDSARLTYIPDCVVVIFDSSIGKRYHPPAGRSSAWGDEEQAEH